MKEFLVDRRVPADQEDRFLRTFPGPKEYDLMVEETAALRRPDGTPLCFLIKGAIPMEELAPMYQAIHNRITATNNRGVSSGQTAKPRIKKDGSVSKTSKVDNPVLSSVMGFYDRYPRIPYCRQTSFNQQHPGQFDACLPAIRRVDSVFRDTVPERYEAQKAYALRTSPDFLVPGTTFTTVTLNKNFRTACHRDAGDLKEGFGCMAYMRSGRFYGGELVFPAYRAGLRMETGDLVLFDPHEIHGNTEIRPVSEKWERLTCVFYYRAKMAYCGSAAQELARAKRFGAKGVGSTTIDWREGLNDTQPAED